MLLTSGLFGVSSFDSSVVPLVGALLLLVLVLLLCADLVGNDDGGGVMGIPV